MNDLVANFNLALVLGVAAILVNAFNARLTSAPAHGVLGILALRHIAKIRPSVIRVDPIDVVDNAARPTASHDDPGKPMSLVHHVINPDSYVALRMDIASPLVWPAFPNEDSRLRVVVNAFADLFRSMMGVSHGESFSLVGQRPRAISRRIWASSF